MAPLVECDSRRREEKDFSGSCPKIRTLYPRGTRGQLDVGSTKTHK